MNESEKNPGLLFSLAAALLAVTLVFTYFVGSYVVRWGNAMTAQRAVVQHLTQVGSTLTEAETGQRGYLLTGKTSYLDPYQSAVERLHSEQNSLHRLVAQHELPADDVAALDRNIASKMAELEKTIETRKTNAEAAVALVQTGEGKREMDLIRAALGSMIDREEREYRRMAQKSHWATIVRTTTFIFTGVTNLAFLGWVYRRLRNETERRQAAAQKLQNTIESISDGLMVLDRNWHITYLSKQGGRILRVDEYQMIGKNIWDVVPQARERQACPYFYEAMEKGIAKHFEEHYSGADQWLEIHCYPSPEGLTVYFHDVTERKQAEAVLARSKEQLEKLVAERTAKLEELVGELEHFSYTITHDMRSPLRAMTGFAQVLEELGPTCPDEQRQHFLARISVAARRMDLLITDALNYNRAVREQLPEEPVDVAALVRGMLDTYPEFQPSKANIRIVDELPFVLGNEAGLTQVFSNLIGNAVKFVKPGQVPHVTIRSETREDWVRIWVEDEGIGIMAAVLPKVFDMFSRGQTGYDGTGIGLALVRKVVMRMGGRVGVESEQGKGSRFWVELRPIGTARREKLIAPQMVHS
jgi:PAS domain S-box-containing protein